MRAFRDTSEISNLALDRDKILDSAEQLLLSSVLQFEKVDGLKDLSFSHKLLSDIYQLKDDYQKAFFHFERYNALQDSIHSVDKRVKMANIGEERAELEKKRQEKIALQQKKLRDLSEEKRRNETIAFLLGIVILSVFTIFIFKERRKSERLLLNILPQSVVAEFKKERNI